MSAIIFLLLGIIPPLVAGPVAGVVFLNILHRGKGWYQIPFWLALVGLNLLVMLWTVSSSGKWLSVSSFAAFFFTPAAAILTPLVMRRAWNKMEAAGTVNGKQKAGYTVGVLLIPVFQVGIFLAMLILAPWLCTVGVLVCPKS